MHTFVTAAMAAVASWIASVQHFGMVNNRGLTLRSTGPAGHLWCVWRATSAAGLLV
jgi:hypothetical protein